jgi:glucarate dehydratase
MKVVRLETFPVSIPYTHAEISARVQRAGVSDVIVKLTTDDGLVGWGESCSGPDTLSVEHAVRSMAPFVVGQSPWATEAIAASVFSTGLWDRRLATGNFAFAGIDMALWDLCGKAVGQPIYRMFGGAVRADVDYFNYLARGTPDELAAQCRAGIKAGYRCFYLKVGVDSAAEEAMLEAVRANIGPDAKIRIDANEAWSMAEAVRLLTRWDRRFGIDFAEAPVGAFPLSQMVDLRRRVPAAICMNEGLESQASTIQAIVAGAADVLCFSSYWVGSLRRWHTLSHLAALHGIGMCKHTHGEFGLAATAGQHVLLTLPNAVAGAQQTASVMVDDILTERLPIADGPKWGPIEGPGLGVTVSEEKLGQYHEAFLRDGQFLPYAAAGGR